MCNPRVLFEWRKGAFGVVNKCFFKFPACEVYTVQGEDPPRRLPSSTLFLIFEGNLDCERFIGTSNLSQDVTFLWT